MTRHDTSSTPDSAGRRRLLQPLQPARNLTEEIVARIAAEIRSGRLAPGARLPTELELMTAMGVSRTVVREAVAALKAEGLVVTRQGLGAFVAIDASRVAFRIASEGKAGSSSITDVLSVMELRLAVEVEAAALAAERASERELVRIDSALAAIDAAIGDAGTAVAEDFAFHRSIAEATHNPHFVQFLDFLGRHVIPRHAIRAAQGTREEQLAYLGRLQKEHARIAVAISARNVAGARKAMRAHLDKSLARYRTLAAAQASMSDSAGK
jgi:DNA-binding FadR family transcriptional regulator